MKLFDKTWKLALSGVVIGLLVMLLAMSGNPANMAICVACFIRDAAGALKLHTAAPVQYFRPEIVGFVCGSFLISMATKQKAPSFVRENLQFTLPWGMPCSKSRSR